MEHTKINPLTLLENKLQNLISSIEKLLSEDTSQMVTNPKTGKQIKASSSLSPDHPAYAAAKRLLQGKKLSAGQRRGLKKMANAALSKARPTKGPTKMKKSEKTSSQSAYKQQRGREREGAKSDTAYSVYGPDN
jgi:hypothetical protein